MKLKIGTKLISSFLLIVLLMAILAFYSAGISQTFLKDAVGKSSKFLAEEMLQRIDQGIYLMLEVFQTHLKHQALQNTVLKSNEEFEKLASIENFVAQKDREWTTAAEEEVTSHMNALLSNELSNELREEFIRFYEEKYGYRVFAEVFATNKYGANVAQTGKTTDYRQDDEEWWQIARERGFYIGDFEFDKSVETNGFTIGVRIDDSEDSFIGVIRAFVSAEEIIKEAEISIKKYETTSVKLTTKDGKLIYSTKAFRFLEDVSEKNFFKNIASDSGFFISEESGRQKLFSFARSKGYKDFHGHGWILVMGHDASEVLKPAVVLRNSIIVVSLVLIAAGIFSAYFISHSLSRPIIKLRNAALEIAQGNLDKRVEAISKDEIGQLTVSFNEMTGKLKESYAGLEEKVQERTAELEEANDELATEITERKRTEKELAKHRERLEELVQERTVELRKTINLMAGREVRMAELKETIKKLRAQLGSAGLTPLADDPLKETIKGNG